MNELTGLHFSRWVTLVLCGTWNGAASLFSCVVSLFGSCSSILPVTLNAACVHRLGNWCSYTVIASLNSIQFQHIWFRCVLIVDEISTGCTVRLLSVVPATSFVQRTGETSVMCSFGLCFQRTSVVIVRA